ncbi:MAG: metal-dependent phosphohydrolase [Leptolyngbya sp. SIO1E4]|nr:metal-dependent phosphohydrolase [Leptolyngbya sp. SIO1E4]
MLEGSILKRLVTSHQHQQGALSLLNFGVYYKNTLVALCHALEDCILATDSQPLVITAFQQGKWYLQEAERYGAIADTARQIVIMATPDTGFHSHPTSQRDHVALIDLTDDDPVAQEWHLMILSPNYTAMVLCQELSPEDYGIHGVPTQDLERKFYGFWTFDPHRVRETIDYAIQHVGRYNLALQQTLENQVKDILSANPNLTEAASGEAVGAAVARVLEYLEDSRAHVLDSSTSENTDALRQNLTSNELQAFLRMAQLVDIMDPVNPEAAKEVVSLLEMMGQLIDLPAWRLQRLRLAGWLHRTAPFHPEMFSETTAPSCPLVPGTQVLRRMPRLRAIATIITHQTEYWDGSGQPAGLAGDQIPLESRMLGLASYFQGQVVAHGQAEAENPLVSALETCQSEQGERWDPKLIEILALMVKGLQQGLSLPAIPVKISMGVGLLSPEVDAWDYPVFSQSSSVK